MKSRLGTIDPLDIPDELKPLLARFFKHQSSKSQCIQRDVIYPFEKRDLAFTHDIYPHSSHNHEWCADVLEHKSFYHNDFTTGRKVIAVIHPAPKQQIDGPALVAVKKSKRSYFFLAPELHSRISIFNRFPERRPRFYTFNNTNIVSQVVQGESVFDFLNDERDFAGKVLSSAQRFRMVISLIRETMNYHMRSVCNREITVKDIVYDKQTNQTQFLSFRLAKMMNDTSLSSGGTANSMCGAPEEFVSQSSGKLITTDDYKKRSSIISLAGLAADVFMVGFVSINVWRHVYKNHRANAAFTDYFLQRAEQEWVVEPNPFEEIYDLNAQEQAAIIYLSNLMLNPKNPELRPSIEDCFFRYQQLYLNHKLTLIEDDAMRARVLAANRVAHGLHTALSTITTKSIFLNDCKVKLTEFALKLDQPCKRLHDKLESNIKKDYLHGIILQKWQSIMNKLNLSQDANIAEFLQKLTVSVSAATVKQVLENNLRLLEDHPDAIAELVEYCDLRCLFGIDNKSELLAKIHHVIEHHAAMLKLFHAHENKFPDQFRKIKSELASDPVTLDNLDKQAAHIERKLGKLQINHSPVIYRRIR